MTGLLKRVLMISLLVALVMGGVWPFDKKKKAVAAAAQNEEEGPQMPGDDLPPNSKAQAKANKGSKAKKPASQIDQAKLKKLKTKFDSKPLRKMSPADFRDFVQNEVWPDTYNGSDEEEMTERQINRMWSEHMQDFVPEDTFTFNLAYPNLTMFFEEISHEKPTTVKGAYYIQGVEENEQISCVVFDPEKTVVYKKGKASQHIIIFQTTVPGEYTFVFGNFKAKKPLLVSMAFHPYDETIIDPIEYDLDEAGNRIIRGTETILAEKTPEEGDEPGEKHIDKFGNLVAAGDEDVGVVKNYLRDTLTKIKKVQAEAKMSFIRQQGHNESLLDATNWNLYVIVIEVAAFVGILAFQLHHMKNKLDNKLVL